MKSIFKVKNTDSIVFEMTISMPLEEWKALNEMIKDEWPACDFKQEISSMIIQANQHFCPEPKS